MGFKNLILLFLAIVTFSCKALKGKRNCNELISKYNSIEVDSYKALLNYMDIDKDNNLKILWVADGNPLTKDSILNFFNSEHDIEILFAKKIKNEHFSTHDLIGVISTNNCVIKRK